MTTSTLLFSQTPDWSKLPEGKKTRLGLYMTAQQAAQHMEAEAGKTLFVDVRTRAEAVFIGMPKVADALVSFADGPQKEWDDKRNGFAMAPNPDFVAQVNGRLADKKLSKQDTVILMCRSGDRSARAADLLAEAGYRQVYSLVEGFEGDLAKDGPRAGQRAVNGWKNAGLPWSYQLEKAKMPLSR